MSRNEGLGMKKDKRDYKVFFTPSGSEQVYNKVSSIDKLYALMSIVMDLSNEFNHGSIPFRCSLERSEHYGQIVGISSMDKKIRFRLDYDEEYGTHLNYENFKYGKGNNAVKVLIPIDVDEKVYHKTISGYNKKR